VQKADSADARERITREAVAIVRGGGAAALTMRSLAVRMGQSPAALYLHFRDKRELLRAVSETGIEELAAEMVPRLGHPDPRRAVAEATRALVAWGLANARLYRVMFDDLALPGSSPEERQPRARLWSVTRAAFERGIAAGVFRRDLDADAMLMLHWCAIHGFVMLGIAGRNPSLGMEEGRSQSELLGLLVEERVGVLLARPPA
jgi:AcrR family transcriptional regulator